MENQLNNTGELKEGGVLDINEEHIGEKVPRWLNDADFIMTCSCGHVHVIEENVTGILRYELETTDMHNLHLVCPMCGHSLTLHFREAVNPKPIAEPVDEQPQIESVQEPDASTDEDDRGVEQVDEKENIEETEEINEPVQEEGKVQE